MAKDKAIFIKKPTQLKPAGWTNKGFSEVNDEGVREPLENNEKLSSKDTIKSKSEETDVRKQLRTDENANESKWVFLVKFRTIIHAANVS